MNRILADFIAQLNSNDLNNNNSSDIDIGCEYMKLSYEEYKNIKKNKDVLYIVDDAPSNSDIENNVSGNGGIIQTVGKVFKGTNECTASYAGEPLIDIAMRNGYNGVEHNTKDDLHIDTPPTPLFKVYKIVDNFNNIDEKSDEIIYIQESPLEIRIWNSVDWLVLFKKEKINIDDLGEEVLNTINDKLTKEIESAMTLKADKDHNHDSVYSSITHNHNDTYSTKDHNHDSVYSSITHNHNDTYSTKDHNHDSVYSTKTHNHDNTYLKLDGSILKNSLNLLSLSQDYFYPVIFYTREVGYICRLLIKICQMHLT